MITYGSGTNVIVRSVKVCFSTKLDSRILRRASFIMTTESVFHILPFGRCICVLNTTVARFSKNNHYIASGGTAVPAT